MWFKYPYDFTKVDYNPGAKAEYVCGDGMPLARVRVNSEPSGTIHECRQSSLC
mgnify:CR=1 FL=1